MNEPLNPDLDLVLERTVDVPPEKVWTTALGPGYRPALPVTGGKECDELQFTAVILIEPHGDGTKYTAIAIHPDVASAERHAEMGFQEGWGKAFDQLVKLVGSSHPPPVPRR